jgi:hypothetical protein
MLQLDFESLLFSDPVTDEISKCLGWQSNGDFSFLLGFLWASIAGGKEKKKKPTAAAVAVAAGSAITVSSSFIVRMSLKRNRNRKRKEKWEEMRVPFAWRN